MKRHTLNIWRICAAIATTYAAAIAFGAETNALSIGAAPGAIDIGNVPRDSEKLVEFYLMTNSNEDMLVGVSYITVHPSIYQKESRTYYTFIPTEASEEDISSWLSIPQNPVLVSPTQTQLVALPDGTSVRYNKKVSFILKVPKNAEPGYHAGAINLQPQLKTTGGGTGISSIGITRVIFAFRVPGYAERNGNIIDMEAERVAENKVQVDVLFKNTGTTTITARLEMIKLFDNFGLAAENIANGQMKKIKPGEIAILSGYWLQNDGIKSGEYKADTRVNYVTGNAIKEETIDIPSTITVKKENPPAEQKQEFPWWLLIIIMMLIGLYVYWRMD